MAKASAETFRRSQEENQRRSQEISQKYGVPFKPGTFFERPSFNPPEWYQNGSPFFPVGEHEGWRRMRDSGEPGAGVDPNYEPQPYQIPGLSKITDDRGFDGTLTLDPRGWSERLPDLFAPAVEAQNRTELAARRLLEDEPGRELEGRLDASLAGSMARARRQQPVAGQTARSLSLGPRSVAKLGGSTRARVVAGRPQRLSDAADIYTKLGPLSTNLVSMYLGETGRNEKMMVRAKEARDRARNAALGQIPIVGGLLAGYGELTD